MKFCIKASPNASAGLQMVVDLSKKTIEHGYYLFACYGDAVKIASKKDMSNLKAHFIREGFTVKEG